MTLSVFSKKYEIFMAMLIEYRNNTGHTQASLAKHLGKPQSFVSKYERGERRIDLIEFLEISDALKINSIDFINELIKRANS